MHKMLIVWPDSVSKDRWICNYVRRLIAHVFVTAFYEHLLSPTRIEVIWYKFYAEFSYLLEYLRRFKCSISINISKYACDTFRELILFKICKVLIDAVDTFHVYCIMSRLTMISDNKDFFCVFKMNIRV